MILKQKINNKRSINHNAFANDKFLMIMFNDEYNLIHGEKRYKKLRYFFKKTIMSDDIIFIIIIE